MENLFLIGNVVRVERNFNHISQHDLAKVLNINQSTVSRIENGDPSINYKNYLDELTYFGINLSAPSQKLEAYLFEIYQLMDLIETEKVNDIYKNIIKLKKLNIFDYYTKKLIIACYNLYHKNMDIFNQYMKHIMEIEEIFTDKTKFMYLIIKGYYYHLNRMFLKADDIFHEVKSLEYNDQIEDNLYHYIHAFNHIILRRYHLAHIYLIKLSRIYNHLGNNYKEMMTKRLLGILYYSDSLYHETIQVFSTCLSNKLVIEKNPFLRTQFNSYLGSSHLALKHYKQAIPYFKDNINQQNEDRFLVYSYAYLFYCLKKTNNESEFISYKKQMMKEAFFKEKATRTLIQLFADYHKLIDYHAFSQNFNILYQNIFQYHDLYQHTKLIFLLTKDELWKQRKYLLYKQLNEVILKMRIGEIG